MKEEPCRSGFWEKSGEAKDGSEIGIDRIDRVVGARIEQHGRRSGFGDRGTLGIEAEGVQDPPSHGGLGDEGNDRHSAFASRASENVQGKDSLQKLCPRNSLGFSYRERKSARWTIGWANGDFHPRRLGQSRDDTAPRLGVGSIRAENRSPSWRRRPDQGRELLYVRKHISA